ncbi:hypothetical protein CASFOL_028454 [Castilleja foliolosa]|uniref:Uncharacterized protein n=1 Tax=Castilleja foliolosa TaxID=1961234 RepID=A0ABD3CCN1_9LAMI
MTVVGSSAGDSSPPDVILPKDKSEPLGLHIQHIPPEDGGAGGPDINSSPPEGSAFDFEDGVNVGPSFEEHQFIPSFNGKPIMHQDDDRLESENLSVLRNSCDEDLSFSLQLELGENEPKRRKTEPGLDGS